MTVTVSDFRSEFPDFGKATEAQVSSSLARAARMVNPDVWAESTDDGVLYLAAHFVALSPGGEFARLDPKAVTGDDPIATTIYGAQFVGMRDSFAAGPCVI